MPLLIFQSDFSYQTHPSKETQMNLKACPVSSKTHANRNLFTPLVRHLFFISLEKLKEKQNKSYCQSIHGRLYTVDGMFLLVLGFLP